MGGVNVGQCAPVMQQPAAERFLRARATERQRTTLTQIEAGICAVITGLSCRSHGDGPVGGVMTGPGQPAGVVGWILVNFGGLAMTSPLDVRCTLRLCHFFR